MATLRIATRRSQLALWQANYVKQQLQNLNPQLEVELVKIVTQGDKILDKPLADIGGKGLFVKEIEAALLDGRAHIAVHSMKDVPVDFAPGLKLAVICERADARDAFLSETAASLQDLPQGATVGTSSLRRRSQLLALRPDVVVEDLRGNVDTRVNKLQQGLYQAIILASAGLHRLSLQQHITEYFATEVMLPAAGQGAVGIECRSDDDETLALLAPLNHETTRCCVLAERAMNRELGGSCEVPIGAHATISHGTLQLHGFVGNFTGDQHVRGEHQGNPTEADAIGQQLAQQLIQQGANTILQSIHASK